MKQVLIIGSVLVYCILFTSCSKDEVNFDSLAETKIESKELKRKTGPTIGYPACHFAIQREWLTTDMVNQSVSWRLKNMLKTCHTNPSPAIQQCSSLGSPIMTDLIPYLNTNGTMKVAGENIVLTKVIDITKSYIPNINKVNVYKNINMDWIFNPYGADGPVINFEVCYYN